ncbi:protein ATP1B4 isoform X1 [Latimeria chalumnae]|uniref:Sodium/potassium-transporting ATPase subunit beta n=2 Tax=Latimeria chalumnae TaxID=7897 RepID=H3AD33_LATCH|nr:PREDICTED: protein ATP1B4 isoform X2 [Latimeria chalumnae]|eukprot:XP_006003908.1 PREDICTED: protein ATP1B4 isoform X2 [Latimeria chalumnae]
MGLNSTTAGAEDSHERHLQIRANNEGKGKQQKSEEEEEEEKKMVEPKKSWGEITSEFRTFMWNPEKKEFIGRNCKSWTLILLFYFVFYLYLAGIFALCLYVMLLTISPYTPKHRDKVVPPGVMMRPNINGFDISFNKSEHSTWSSYVENLHTFLNGYNDSVQIEKNIECVPGKYFMQDMGESEGKRACQFKRTVLESCSGIKDPTFGYSKGKPCVLIKMNRIIGYLPGQGTPVTVTCEVQKGDSGAIGSIDFYPGNGTFNLMYYPYYGKLTHVNYTSPLVAVHFTNVKHNTPLTIQCKLNGPGIVNDSSDRYLGRISFTLNVGE